MTANIVTNCNWSSYIQIHQVKKHVLMMMGYDGICGFIGCEHRRVGLLRFHLGVVGHISLRPHKENHFRPLNMRKMLDGFVYG